MAAHVSRLSGIVLACSVLSFSARLIGQQPNQTADRLVSRFNGASFFFKQFEIAREIVALDDRRVFPQLLPFLTAVDRHVRGNAAFIFAALGDDRGFQILSQMLSDRSPRPEGQGALIMGVVSGNPAWKLPCPPQIPADRSYAAHLFGELKDPRAVPILVPLLQDSEVEDKVIWSLGQIGDKAAIQPLIGILGDGSPDMRFLAIHALQNLRATEALPAIQQLLSDHDHISFDRSVEVSDAAEQAITKLH